MRIKTRDRFATFAVLNVCLLVGGLIIAVTAAGHNMPHQKATRDAFHTHINRLTNDEKLRRMLIADDEDIRALENLGAAYQKGLIEVCFVVSGLALGNLLLFPWKNQRP